MLNAVAVLLMSWVVLPEVSSPVSGVSIAPGVVFAPSSSWANISFAMSQTFGSVHVDRTGVLFDTVRLGVAKTPASFPRANVVVSTWNPLQTTLNGTVLDFSGNAPTGATLTFSLSNLIPARQYLFQVDGVQQADRFSNLTGFMSFSWSNFTVHDLTVLLGSRTGLPPPAPPLSADFSFAPRTPGVGQRVTFSGVAGGGSPPYNYSWTFGDGTTSSGANVSHAYPATGNETVALTAVDVAGASAIATKIVAVQGIPAPPSLEASFAFAPAAPYPGTPVIFTSVVSGGTPPFNYSWAFGDGFFGYRPSVVHEYGRAGRFNVTLAVRDVAGAIAPASSNVTVRSPPGAGPGNVVAAFEYSINGAIVTFADRSSSDVGLPIIIHFWAFGDGTSSQEPNPVHEYPLPGLFATYTVVLASCDSGSHCAATSGTVSLVNWLLLIEIVLLVAAVVVLLVFVKRRRRRRNGVRGHGDNPSRRSSRVIPHRENLYWFSDVHLS